MLHIFASESKFKVMARMHIRKNRKDEYRIDIRCLSYDEYKMLYALILSSYVAYKESGVKVQSLASFDLRYIEPIVFVDATRLNTLAKLLKVFTK